MSKDIESMLRNAIDLHVHVGPECLKRKYLAQELTKSEDGKLSGICVKSHFCTTAPIVFGVNSKTKLYGSITLNNFVGGLNPEAVYASAALSKDPIIVWFPTVNSENHLNNSNYEFPPEWGETEGRFKPRLSRDVEPVRILEDGKLVKKAEEVLNVIQEYGCVLATGHLSPRESQVLVGRAIEKGIKKVIVTHPIYQKINMSLGMQKQLALKGAVMEHCYSMYTIDKIKIQEIARQIREIEVVNCILSSDLGQIKSVSPSQGLREFASLLIQEGLTEEDIEMMLIKNPKRLVER